MPVSIPKRFVDLTSLQCSKEEVSLPVRRTAKEDLLRADSMEGLWARDLLKKGLCSRDPLKKGLCSKETG